ncbi:MAG: permease prefix domain 2-containing transporter [Bacteroidota bacterium]
MGTFCPPELIEEIEGDLLQRFQKDLTKHGQNVAKRKLIWNTVRFIRPSIILRKQALI